MNLRRAWFAGLMTIARRALLLGGAADGQPVQQNNLPPTSLGSSWVLEARVRRDDTRTSYFVVFSTTTYTDAFGLYSGFGPGGYTFFARDKTDTTNYSPAITDASQSPVNQWQVVRVTFAGGWLRGYYDGKLGFERKVGTFYFDPPVSLVLGFRPGAPGFNGALDYLFLESEGSRLFDYSFNESSGPAFNRGTAGGHLDNVYFSPVRELLP